MSDQGIKVKVSPTVEMLRMANLMNGTGYLNDPEGSAVRAQAMETLLREQHKRLEICPVTQGVDTSGELVADGIQRGRRQTDAHIAFSNMPRIDC